MRITPREMEREREREREYGTGVQIKDAIGIQKK